MSIRQERLVSLLIEKHANNSSKQSLKNLDGAGLQFFTLGGGLRGRRGRESEKGTTLEHA